MHRKTPELVDYLAFFEVEPDPPVNAGYWYWENMVFRTVRGGVDVRCEVFPGAGRVALRVADGERLVVDIGVEPVESIRLEHRGAREVMIVRVVGQGSALILALRPALHVGWAVDDGD